MFVEPCTCEGKMGLGSRAFFAHYQPRQLMEVYLVTYAVYNDPVCSSWYIEKADSSGRNFDVYVENARTDRYKVEFYTDLFYRLGSLGF